MLFNTQLKQFPLKHLTIPCSEVQQWVLSGEPVHDWRDALCNLQYINVHIHGQPFLLFSTWTSLLTFVVLSLGTAATKKGRALFMCCFEFGHIQNWSCYVLYCWKAYKNSNWSKFIFLDQYLVWVLNSFQHNLSSNISTLQYFCFTYFGNETSSSPYLSGLNANLHEISPHAKL